MDERFLERLGLWGALLTCVILAMSVLLRLGHVPAGADLVATLPATIEQGARIAHRIAAMGVGLIAALALVHVLRLRPAPRQRLAAVIAVAALTLLLAVIGRYTTGYRFAAVTVANVVGGFALACAFWWLRAQARGPLGGGLPIAGWILAVLFALAALGSAASHEALHGGVPGTRTAHAVLGIAVTAMALAACWRSRRWPALAAGVVALCVLQLALGAWIFVGTDARVSIAPAWAHAMGGLVLALALVTLATGRRGAGGV